MTDKLRAGLVFADLLAEDDDIKAGASLTFHLLFIAHSLDLNKSIAVL